MVSVQEVDGVVFRKARPPFQGPLLETSAGFIPHVHMEAGILVVALQRPPDLSTGHGREELPLLDKGANGGDRVHLRHDSVSKSIKNSSTSVPSHPSSSGVSSPRAAKNLK